VATQAEVATHAGAATRAEASSAARALEGAPAEEVVAWARDRFGAGLVLAASFQDCVLIDLATRVVPDIEVVFLDTGAHFPETLAFVQQVRRRYQLRLQVRRPVVRPDEDPCGSARCCELRKVALLDRALQGRTAWMTGLRRVEATTRSSTPVVGWDERRGLSKISPLAAWTDADVEAFARARNLPVHPLAARGYTSIGCQPTTRPVADGEHQRAGRWAGTTKTECGLHA
ncbi:MAG: phosphoadenylyl-sulfate reductase, partial [Nitriliruptorales bacterium]|nr:phosphoadenylyl-sulfate reductase [Nitriliruptorales bacterium]